jgi:ankyrin repeat protein
VEVVRFFLEFKHAEVDQTAAKGATALHLAAGNGNVELACLLIGDGEARVDKTMEGGITALHIAAEKGFLDLLKFLVRDGKAAVDKASLHCTTLSGACGAALHIAVRNGHIEVVHFLVLEGNASIDQACADGSTPLLIAAQMAETAPRGDSKSLKMLRFLADHASVDQSTLYICAEKGYCELARILIQNGKVRIDEARKYSRDTALHIAARFGKVKILHVLVEEAQANVHAINSDWLTPYGVAQDKNATEVVRYLEQATHAKQVQVQKNDVSQHSMITSQSPVMNAQPSTFASLPGSTQSTVCAQPQPAAAFIKLSETLPGSLYDPYDPYDPSDPSDPSDPLLREHEVVEKLEAVENLEGGWVAIKVKELDASGAQAQLEEAQVEQKGSGCGSQERLGEQHVANVRAGLSGFVTSTEKTKEIDKKGQASENEVMIMEDVVPSATLAEDVKVEVKKESSTGAATVDMTTNADAPNRKRKSRWGLTMTEVNAKSRSGGWGGKKAMVEPKRKEQKRAECTAEELTKRAESRRKTEQDARGAEGGRCSERGVEDSKSCIQGRPEEHQVRKECEAGQSITRLDETKENEKSGNNSGHEKSGNNSRRPSSTQRMQDEGAEIGLRHVKEELQQANRVLQEAKKRAEEAELTAKGSEKRAQNAEQRSHLAKQGVWDARQRAQKAETRAQESERQTSEVKGKLDEAIEELAILRGKVDESESAAKRSDVQFWIQRKHAQQAEETARQADATFQQAEKMTEEVGLRAQETEERAQEGERRAQEAEERVQQAEDKVKQAEATTRQAEERAQQAEQRAQSLVQRKERGGKTKNRARQVEEEKKAEETANKAWREQQEAVARVHEEAKGRRAKEMEEFYKNRQGHEADTARREQEAVARVREAEEREFKMTRQAGERVQNAEYHMRLAEQRVQGMVQQVKDAVSHAKKAELAMQQAGKKVWEAEQGAQKAVQTAQQAEQRVQGAEQKARVAELRALNAEQAKATQHVEQRAQWAAEQWVLQRAQKAEEGQKAAELRTKQAEDRALHAKEWAATAKVAAEVTVASLSGNIVSLSHEFQRCKANADAQAKQIQDLSKALNERNELLEINGDAFDELRGRLQESEKVVTTVLELEEKLKALKEKQKDLNKKAASKLASAEATKESHRRQLKQAQSIEKELEAVHVKQLEVHMNELEAVQETFKDFKEKHKDLSKRATAELRSVEMERDAEKGLLEVCAKDLAAAQEKFQALKEKQKEVNKKAASKLRSAEANCNTYQHELQRAHDEGKEMLEKHAKEQKELDVMRLQRDHLLSTVECAVCIETKKKPTVLLPCCHSFCEMCVAQCLRTSGGSLKDGAECPICRAATTDAKRLF